MVAGAAAAEPLPAGNSTVSVGSLGGVVSAHHSPTLRKSTAPTAGSHIGVAGSGGAGGAPWEECASAVACEVS